MYVKLLECTPDAAVVVAAAARQCYNEGYVGDTYRRTLNTDDKRLIREVIKAGHTSVLEHASFTFAIQGISRACSHQLVRFRVASFSQQSQRYCALEAAFPFVIPPSIMESRPMTRYRYKQMMASIGALYRDMVEEGIPKEDARFIIPNACETNIVMTMNARELHHAFSLRCCERAQWEIRDLFNEILRLVKHKAPTLFENVGPTCVTDGFCKEGKRSCGKLENTNG